MPASQENVDYYEYQIEEVVPAGYKEGSPIPSFRIRVDKQGQFIVLEGSGDIVDPVEGTISVIKIAQPGADESKEDTTTGVTITNQSYKLLSAQIKKDGMLSIMPIRNRLPLI